MVVLAPAAPVRKLLGSLVDGGFPDRDINGRSSSGPRVRARVVVSGMQWRHERRQAILSREAGEGDHAKHGGGGDPKRGAWAYALHGRSRSARTSPGPCDAWWRGRSQARCVGLPPPPPPAVPLPRRDATGE